MADQPDPNSFFEWTYLGVEDGEPTFLLRARISRVGPNVCVPANAPAWFDGRGQFTSRLPYGEPTAAAFHHLTGTVDDYDDSADEGLLTKLDGARCILEACLLAQDYVFDAIIEETGHAVGKLLEGLIPGILLTMAAVGITTLAGAGIGALLGLPEGGVGAIPGSAIGAKFGFDLAMFLLAWIGVGFLIKMVGESLMEAGRRMQAGILTAWRGRGMEENNRRLLIETGAHQIAGGVGVLARAMLEGVVLYIVGKGAVSSTGRLAASTDQLVAAGQRLVADRGRLASVLSELRKSRSLSNFADWIEANIDDLLNDPRTNPNLRPSSKGGGPPVEEPPPAQKPAPKQEPAPEKKPATTAEKGVFGEAKGDEFMAKQGMQKMNGEPVKVGDQPAGQGIDGVWKNPKPPPDYVISETKYGSSRLGTTKDGKQMSDQWIDRRLNDAVGRAEANSIRKSMLEGKVEKWLLKVDEAGNVTKVILK